MDGVGGLGMPQFLQGKSHYFCIACIQKKRPSSTSTVEAATKPSIVQRTLVAPLLSVGCLAQGMLDAAEEIIPSAWRVFGTLKYDASQSHTVPCRKNGTRSSHLGTLTCSQEIGNTVTSFVPMLLPAVLQAC